MIIVDSKATIGNPFDLASKTSLEYLIKLSGNGNTYNAGDEYNAFNYSLLKERDKVLEIQEEIAKLENGIII